MLRVGKAQAADALGAEGVRPTTLKGRPFTGYITLDETAWPMLPHWVALAVHYTLSLSEGG